MQSRARDCTCGPLFFVKKTSGSMDGMAAGGRVRPGKRVRERSVAVVRPPSCSPPCTLSTPLRAAAQAAAASMGQHFPPSSPPTKEYASELAKQHEQIKVNSERVRLLFRKGAAAYEHMRARTPSHAQAHPFTVHPSRAHALALHAFSGSQLMGSSMLSGELDAEIGGLNQAPDDSEPEEEDAALMATLGPQGSSVVSALMSHQQPQVRVYCAYILVAALPLALLLPVRLFPATTLLALPLGAD